MPPSLSQPIYVDSDSNSDPQSELFKLKSEFFKDLIPNKNFNALLFTKSSTESSSQSFEWASKKWKTRAVNTWALMCKPTGNKPLVNNKGR